MQGTIVDRIDYNIQNVSASVEEGLKQLEKVSLSLSVFTYWIRLMLIHIYLLYNVCLFGFAGRENTKTRRDGDVCLSTRYHVFCNASPSDPERDYFLMNIINPKSFFLFSSCWPPIFICNTKKNMQPHYGKLHRDIVPHTPFHFLFFGRIVILRRFYKDCSRDLCIEHFGMIRELLIGGHI